MQRVIRWTVAPMVALAIALAFSTMARAADDKDKSDTKGTVTGTVVDKDGKAVTGAKIRVVPVGAKKKDASSGGATSAPATPGDSSGGAAADKTKTKSEAVAEGTTDADGKFSLKDVPSGEYTVHATVKGQGAGKEKVSVKSGETADVKITIQPTAAKTKKPK